jgi:LuxR family maltose regulon positive regulatory protein
VTTPKVRDEQEQVLTVGTAACYTWLETASTFSFVGAAGTFTARREKSGHKRGGWYWKAYRRQHGKLVSRYMGKSETLTLERLQAVAADLAPGEKPGGQGSNPREATSFQPDTSSKTSPETIAKTYGETLLLTKFFIPPTVQTMVARPRLVALLTKGVRRPLTLISAPAGWGQTTLLAVWRADPVGSAYPVACISLDKGDNDPVRFWAYLMTALNTFRTGICDTTLAMIRSPQPPPME